LNHFVRSQPGDTCEQTNSDSTLQRAADCQNEYLNQALATPDYQSI